MKVTRLITAGPDGPVDCMGGSCPAFRLTEDGNVLVQGYVVGEASKAALLLPDGEDVVCVPASVLEKLFERLHHE